MITGRVSGIRRLGLWQPCRAFFGDQSRWHMQSSAQRVPMVWWASPMQCAGPTTHRGPLVPCPPVGGSSGLARRPRRSAVWTAPMLMPPWRFPSVSLGSWRATAMSLARLREKPATVSWSPGKDGRRRDQICHVLPSVLPPGRSGKGCWRLLFFRRRPLGRGLMATGLIR